MLATHNVDAVTENGRICLLLVKSVNRLRLFTKD